MKLTSTSSISAMLVTMLLRPRETVERFPWTTRHDNSVPQHLNNLASPPTSKRLGNSASRRFDHSISRKLISTSGQLDILTFQQVACPLQGAVAISKHLLHAHGDKKLINEDQFRVLKKCRGKFDCLGYEMLFIKELRPSLNSQSDAISAKLSCLACSIFCCLSFLMNYCFFLYL